MAQSWHDAPEVVPHSFPEVYYPKPASVAPNRGEDFSSIPLKSFNPFDDRAASIDAPKSSYAGAIKSIHNYDAQSTRDVLPPAERPRETPRRFRGFSILVLALSAIIALLSVAVIGLAAGTGIQTSRTRKAESKLAAYLSTIDLGCAANPDLATGTRYASDCKFAVTVNTAACASYSTYTPGNFPDVSTFRNFTCSAVSFIPDWTNRTEALKVNAPGNCYLKPGPQNPAAFTHPNANGPAVHAAILQTQKLVAALIGKSVITCIASYVAKHAETHCDREQNDDFLKFGAEIYLIDMPLFSTSFHSTVNSIKISTLVMSATRFLVFDVIEEHRLFGSAVSLTVGAIVKPNFFGAEIWKLRQVFACLTGFISRAGAPVTRNTGAGQIMTNLRATRPFDLQCRIMCAVARRRVLVFSPAGQ
ncbi:hypothetical protein FHL15_000015 [Xylaria flabelliformis]|uniref:Uncharacterized protein n=1 Tax=Xylaria flabelliformis TaxID=2512241 RepID=A0A553IEN9_9PEZI|nr:hypothetical protein FHL15_000015 [Xylaria flabelliformis]